MTTSEKTRENYRATTEAFLALGYDVVNGRGKGGFWVRNQDGSKVAFTDHRNFLLARKAQAVLDAMSR